MGRSMVFVLSLCTCLICMVGCDPPPDPVKCNVNGISNCTVTNAYGMFPDRATCKAADVSYPSSEAELAEAVATATMSRRKMKVTTRYSHSIPKLVCPDGEDALLISTKKLNRVVSVDDADGTIVVESGILLRDVMEAAAKAGMALPYTPYWWGITVGGLLSTGSHGSTLWGGSSVHDHVVAVRIVTPAGPEDGFVKVREINDSSPDELNAVKVSLGVLGVISQVKLKLQPMFKRSLAYSVASDSVLGEEVMTFGGKHEFADISWYPSQQKAVYRLDDRVDIETKGDGRYDFVGFRGTSRFLVSLLGWIEETQESTNDVSGKCIQGELTTSSLHASAYGLTNNGVIFTGYPVIGYQDKIQSSGSCLNSMEDALLTACEWDPRIKDNLFHQTTFSIALPNVTDFIREVQTLVALEPKSLCGLNTYNGILMRYVKASSAYLGKQEDSVDFDMTYYRSKDPMTPRMFEDVLEEIEQMGVFKYGALPHWGKNRNVAFAGAVKKYWHYHKFLKVKEEYDPSGLFSNEWTDKVLGLDEDGVMIERDGCALEGLCVCSRDSHCAPTKGYYCRPGKVYKDARVCTKI